MNNDTNLYTKTKELLNNDDNPEDNIIQNTFNTHSITNNTNPNSDGKNNQYSYANKSNIQINNERILNLNKLINEGKEKIENTLSPLKSLIEKGININKKNKEGNTALHLAYLKNYKEIINILEENGIDTNIRNNNNKLAEEMNFNFKPNTSISLLVNFGVLFFALFPHQ